MRFYCNLNAVSKCLKNCASMLLAVPVITYSSKTELPCSCLHQRLYRKLEISGLEKFRGMLNKIPFDRAELGVEFEFGAPPPIPAFRSRLPKMPHFNDSMSIDLPTPLLPNTFSFGRLIGVLAGRSCFINNSCLSWNIIREIFVFI